jgi:hypothetical protein
MRTLIVAAGLVAGLALAGCEQSKSEASATPPPPVHKSLARQAQFYAGQEQILSVSSANVAMERGKLVLKVDGQAPGAGYTDAVFVPRIYAAAPKDGIYEVDVVATKPAGAGASAAAPIVIEHAWSGYPEGRLKGVKFISKTNEMVAMLPAQAPAKAGS